MNLHALYVGMLFVGILMGTSLEVRADLKSGSDQVLYSMPAKIAAPGAIRIAPKYLQTYDFVINPRTQEIVEMKLRSERPVANGEVRAPFSPESIRSGDYVLEKSKYDQKLGFEPRQGRAAWSEVDQAEALVGPLKYKKLAHMESNGLTAARLNRVPWSSSYWPTYAGGLAIRYADPDSKVSKDWKKNIERLKDTFPKSLSELKAEQIDVLSPAEKYDLLVGDSNFTLTRQEFSSAESAAEASGKVETWEGKCHGWAPAAYMEQRPQHSVSVRAYDPEKANHEGVAVKFYPDDIKALATLLWANASTQTRFVGSRCNVKSPKVDENGRILEEDCFDTNPGTWHLLAVNQIGVNKKGFVLDATYDYEVWNQPAFGYEYTYFNPKEAVKKWDLEEGEKFAKVDSWKDAQVSLKDFSEDKFKKYRGDKAVSVVGVDMKFTYVVETEVSHKEWETETSSVLTAVHYYYDLELDAEGNIVGGEWYQLAHPDFMWAPVTMASSIGDEVLSREQDSFRWKNRELAPISDRWREVAIESSSRSQPLSRIVSELIQKSRKFPGSTFARSLCSCFAPTAQ